MFNFCNGCKHLTLSQGVLGCQKDTKPVFGVISIVKGKQVTGWLCGLYTDHPYFASQDDDGEPE